MLKALRTLDWIVEKILYWFLVFSIVVMVGMAFWQVLCRYFLHITANYAEEFARLAVVWCIYLGAGMGVRHGEHMIVDALIKVLPNWLRWLLKMVTSLFVLALGYVLIVYGIQHYKANAMDFTTSLGYCRNVFYLPAPITGVLICVYTVLDMVTDTINTFRKKEGGAE